MINRIVLVGRLSKDPEVKNTNSGSTVCSFSVAVDNRTKNPDGTKSTSYIPCVVFNNQAENVAKYIRKGNLVGVEGRLNQRNFVRNDGSKGSSFEVICDSVQFLQPKGTGTNQSNDVALDPIDPEIESSGLDLNDVADDDLPF